MAAVDEPENHGQDGPHGQHDARRRRERPRRRIPLASRFVIVGYLAALLGGSSFQAWTHPGASAATPPPASPTAIVHVVGNVASGDRVDLLIELPAASGSDTYAVACNVAVLDTSTRQPQAVVSLPTADAAWLAPEILTGPLVAVPHTSDCEQGEGPHVPETPEPEIVVPAPNPAAQLQTPPPAPSANP